MRAFLDKFRSLFTRNTSRNEFREEFETHLDLLAQHFEQQGMSASEARSSARRQFGNSTLHEQRLTEMRSFSALNNLTRDIRFAMRRLKKSPAFTLTAILTLALGIGASTAIFSIVDGVLLQPLAYRDSGQLVVVWERVRALEKIAPYVGPNPRHEHLWRAQATDFSDLAILQAGAIGVSLGNADHPRFVGRLSTQPNLLDILAIQPALGRNFLPKEALQQPSNVVIISWNLWQSLFHGDPGAIGKAISLAGAPNTVIGVLPKNFYFPKANELTFLPHAGDLPTIDVITPLGQDFSNLSWNGDYGDYTVLGRLKPGVTIAHAQAQLNAISNIIAREHSPDQSDRDGPLDGSLASYVQPLKDALVGKSTRSLWLLFAAVLSVLLIACINLANAQLARSIARDRESALRSALGASAWSLLQSSLAEIGLLTLGGGVLGIALAWLAVHRISYYIHLAVARTEQLSVNPTILALSIFLTVGATLLCGLLPALRLLGTKPQQALQNGTRSVGSRNSNRLRQWLIGLQIFACTTLLLVAGFFSKSLVSLLRSDKGFSSQHILVAQLNLAGSAYTSASRLTLENAILERLQRLPGTQSAALVNAALLNGESNIDPINPPNTPLLLGNYRHISPGYFAVLGQGLLEGRDFNDHDRTASNVIISQATAKAIFPDQEPIGRQLYHDDKLYTIIGVVTDAHNTSLRGNPVNMVYLGYWEQPPSESFFLIRSSQDTDLLADAVRKAIWGYDPALTIASVHSLDSRISEVLSPERLETTILAAFGGSALLLALLGIYGTLSYFVATRRQEIGIRMALGATRRNVCIVILHEVLAPLAVGLLLGWLLSLAIGRSLAAFLYGTTPGDPAVTLSVLALFLLSSAVAVISPCRRATAIDPTEALRAE